MCVWLFPFVKWLVCCWVSGGGVWLCSRLHGELLSVMMSVNKTPEMQLHCMFPHFLVGRMFYFIFININIYMHISCGQPVVVRHHATQIIRNGVVYIHIIYLYIIFETVK